MDEKPNVYPLARGFLSGSMQPRDWPGIARQDESGNYVLVAETGIIGVRTKTEEKQDGIVQ
jgi:hypothetical protein